MEVELLEKIAKNTEHKMSFQIIVSGNETSFNTRFNPKIELDRVKVYEIALVNPKPITRFRTSMSLITYSFILPITVIRG